VLLKLRSLRVCEAEVNLASVNQTQLPESRRHRTDKPDRSRPSRPSWVKYHVHGQPEQTAGSVRTLAAAQQSLNRGYEVLRRCRFRHAHGPVHRRLVFFVAVPTVKHIRDVALFEASRSCELSPSLSA